MKIILGPDLVCPKCGAVEVANPKDPVKDWVWNIRPNKIYHHGKWWSQCMVCVNDDSKGWFTS